MDGGGDSNLWKATADELQHGHLGCGILHGHSVWSQAEIAGSSFNVLVCRIVQVRVEDLLWAIWAVASCMA